MKKTVKMTGRLVRGPGGFSAFIPAPLPPALRWTRELVATLSEADRLVGRLAGEGGRLPNPHLLIRPFLSREAVLSSKIEGTQATLGELLASEAGMSVNRSPAELREVANYVVALEYGIERLKKLPLSLRLVRECHAKLMTDVRGGYATPGEFRRSQNWIGRPGSTPLTASFVPPPPAEMVDCLGEWETFLHELGLPPLIQAGLIHCQFEAIHPFLDGNGRIGRLLNTLFLIERGILPAPLLCLSAFFEATRADYYAGLRRVTETGAWEGWLTYFCNGIAQQAEDALSRAERINRLREQWQAKLAGTATKAAVQLLNVLMSNPFVTANQAMKKLAVSYPTAQRAIDRLLAKGILVKVAGEKRNRAYCAKTILAILEEPANLTPMEPR